MAAQGYAGVLQDASHVRYCCLLWGVCCHGHSVFSVCDLPPESQLPAAVASPPSTHPPPAAPPTLPQAGRVRGVPGGPVDRRGRGQAGRQPAHAHVPRSAALPRRPAPRHRLRPRGHHLRHARLRLWRQEGRPGGASRRRGEGTGGGQAMDVATLCCRRSWAPFVVLQAELGPLCSGFF